MNCSYITHASQYDSIKLMFLYGAIMDIDIYWTIAWKCIKNQNGDRINGNYVEYAIVSTDRKFIIGDLAELYWTSAENYNQIYLVKNDVPYLLTRWLMYSCETNSNTHSGRVFEIV